MAAMSEPELTFSSINEAVQSIQEGRLVVVVDDEDRENEGDFVAAAAKVTPAMIDFMLTHGRGQFCVPLLRSRCDELKLGPAAEENTAKMRTSFRVAVDARNCRTGISATERCATVRAIVNPTTRPDDLVRPGHVSPIMAQEGGVLRRAGHTEATVDLARLAGLYPAGVLCEILDGVDMARRPKLFEIARKFQMPIISIADLIRHRRRTEKLVERTSTAELPTKHGEFQLVMYRVKYEPGEPFALVHGELSRAAAPLVRMHSSCFTGDVLASLRCDCGDQLNLALEMIAREGTGALVYLPQEGRGIGLSEKVKAYELQDRGLDTVEANLALGYRADSRDYGIGIQVLKDLGLTRVRLLTNNPKKSDAFIYYGYELEVVDQVPILAPSNPHRARYMETKRKKMGHRLPPSHAQDPVKPEGER